MIVQNIMPLKIGYQPGHPDLFRLLSTIMSSPSIAKMQEYWNR